MDFFCFTKKSQNFTKKSQKFKYCYMRNILDDKVISILKSKIRECWKDPAANTIIDNFDNLYVLLIKNKYLNELKEHIEQDIYDYLIKNELDYVAGYVLFYKKRQKKTKYIEYTDSIIPGLNVINHILNYYSNRYKMDCIVPFDILQSATGYWEKYFQRNYGINDKYEFNEFIKKNNLVINFILYE